MADAFTQFFEGFGLSGVLSGVIEMGIWAFILVLALVVCGGFAWWFFKKRFRYDIIAKVYAERADGKYKLLLTKAGKKYKRREGIWEMKVRGFPKEYPLPGTEYFDMSTRNQDMIYLLYKDGNMIPLAPPRLNEGRLTDLSIIPYDVQLWNVSRAEQVSATFKSFKDKLLQFLPYVFLVVTMVLFLIMILQVLDRFTILQGIASEMRAAAEALQSCRAVTVPS